MAASINDLYIEQGATFEVSFTVGELGATSGGEAVGAPIDFTGASAAMQIREFIDGPVLVELVTDEIFPPGRTSGDGLTLGGANGTIDVFIAWNLTAGIVVKKGVYDIFVYYPDGYVIRPVKGSAAIDMRITKIDGNSDPGSLPNWSGAKPAISPATDIEPEIQLVTTDGSWTGAISYQYQWQVSSDDVTYMNIAGATTKNYTTTVNDELKYIRVGVAGVNGTGVSSVVWSNPVFVRETSESPLVTIDGVDYFEADAHEFVTTGTGELVTLPSEDVLWVDWGDGSAPVVQPALTRNRVGSMDAEGRHISVDKMSVSNADINTEPRTIRAIFNWNNHDLKLNMDWMQEINRFGLNRVTGQRNQLTEGGRAFQYLKGNPALISTLDTSNLTTMNNMFNNAINFNQPLSSWDTGNVQNFPNMFQNARSFDQDLSSWDTSKVTQAVSVFRFATAFNNGGQPLTWDVSGIGHWQEAFRRCFAFNQPLPWTIKPGINEEKMREMFSEATSFNQDLSSWNVENIPAQPNNFAFNCDAWVLPKPIWGTNGGV